MVYYPFVTVSILLVALYPMVHGSEEEQFSYDPKSPLGPSNWDKLDIPNNQCGGVIQSGINIPTTSTCNEYNATYIFNSGNCTTKDLKFSINDHVIRVDFITKRCTPPSMKIPNVNAIYDVLQYHIHAGSDHTLDGNHFGADMHIVHRNRSGSNLAVLGLFIEPTNNMDSDLFDVLIKGLQDVSAKTKQTCANQTHNEGNGDHRRRRRRLDFINQRDLATTIYNPYLKVPTNSTMYYYKGSLTTPPCSEIVTWNVVDTPIRVSVREYTQIINFILDYINPETCIPASISAPSGYTARPIQPLNGRMITHKCPYLPKNGPPRDDDDDSDGDGDDDDEEEDDDDNSDGGFRSIFNFLVGWLRY